MYTLWAGESVLISKVFDFRDCIIHKQGFQVCNRIIMGVSSCQGILFLLYVWGINGSGNLFFNTIRYESTVKWKEIYRRVCIYGHDRRVCVA